MNMNIAQPKIQIEDLSKIYYQHKSKWGRVCELLDLPFGRSRLRELTVLRNFNLQINRGERVGIIGRNGAGKSTLLRIISGLLRPTGGTVRVNGTVSALFDTSTGFHPDFTGRQNVMVNLAYRGITGRDAETKLEEVIEFSELFDFVDQPFKTYSAGMMSRLTFSVATILRPDILIIDEILGAGDAYFAAKCLDRMTEITSGGATVLLVSHSLGAILQFANRAIWIDRGEVQCDGRPIDVVEQYQKSVEHYERLRTMAKNARLSLKLSPSTVSGTYGRYVVFRIVACDGPDTVTARISRIEFFENDTSRYSLEVGGSMDDSTLYPMFIAEGPRHGSWGKPKSIDGRNSRAVDLMNKETPPSFLVLFPMDPHKDSQFIIKITAASEGEKVIALEALNGAGSFERLTPEIKLNSNGWTEATIPLPSSVYTSERVGRPISLNIASPSSGETGEESDLPVASRIATIRETFPNDSGPVFVLGYTMYRGGSQDTAFYVGERYVGEVEYFCEREIDIPVFVVNITRIDGVRMRQSLSSRDGLEGGRLRPGFGKVRVEIDPLYFGPGSYVVSVGVFATVDLLNEMTMSSPMSLRSNAFEFQVLAQSDVRVDLGCCQVPALWTHSER